MIRLASTLTLPVSAATETFLVVGKRGSGKSSTATRLAEGFIRGKVPIAVLDPVDVWWGLKAGGDGQPAGGFPVYVFGGEHKDLALEPTAGALMADTLVEHRINAVFVLREFSNRDKARFVSDFADELYRRNRDVLHLFCEEAHEVMPQNPYAGEEEMLGRMLRLEKLGRTSGIGMTAITQRPASLNKNATTQAEILVAHRIIGAQDVKAIDGWIEHHHQQEERREVLGTLATLKTGEAWVWAPDFPEDSPVGLKRVNVLMPETFDSRRTPKPGERRATPKALAPVDLASLGERMAATRERTAANDPAKLKAKVRELEAQVARWQSPSSHKVAKIVQTTVEKPVLKDGQIARLESLVKQTSSLIDRLAAARDPLLIALAKVSAHSGAPMEAPRVGARPLDKTGENGTRRLSSVGGPVRANYARAAHISQVVDSDVSADRQGIAPRQRRILDAIATLEELGIDRTSETVAAWCGSHPKSKGYANDLATMRSSGYVAGFELTPEGRAVAGTIAITSARDIIDRLSMPPAQVRILEAVLRAEHDLSANDLAEGLGVHPKTKSFQNNLSALRSRGLVTRGTPVKPAPFFAAIT